MSSNKPTALIADINNSQWRNEFIPGALLLIQGAYPFHIYEANDEYFDLIGYSKQEVFDLFDNNGFATLHPDDRDLAVQNFLYQIEHSKKREFSLTCRLVNKTSGYKSVFFSGRAGLTQSGEAVMYLLITDVTSYAQTLQELEKQQEFNDLIASFTENSYFDYDVTEDVMRYSKDFATRLGISSTILNFSTTIGHSPMLSPEHRHLFFDQLSKPADHLVVSVPEEKIRLTTLSGKSLWYEYSYRLICTDSVVTRVVGKLNDITEHHTQLEQLENQAQRDPATGLYNKIITQHIVDEFLKLSKNQQENHAFFMIDLDHFKQINDRFGHAYGDQVLVDVAQKLTALFRKDDVIGRFGGDEFIVFLKHFNSMDMLYNKALQLCQRIKQSYHKDGVDLCISASVGIALYPNHGTEYDTLYRNADVALYTAKSKGRDQFFVCD